MAESGAPDFGCTKNESAGEPHSPLHMHAVAYSPTVNTPGQYVLVKPTVFSMPYAANNNVLPQMANDKSSAASQTGSDSSGPAHQVAPGTESAASNQTRPVEGMDVDRSLQADRTDETVKENRRETSLADPQTAAKRRQIPLIHSTQSKRVSTPSNGVVPNKLADTKTSVETSVAETGAATLAVPPQTVTGRKNAPRKATTAHAAKGSKNKVANKPVLHQITNQPLPLSNKFEVLAAEHSQNTDEVPVVVKKLRPPPAIQVKDFTYAQVREALRDCQVKHTLQIVGRTIKVFASSAADRNLLIDYMKSRNLYFFTHQAREEGMLRTTVAGLPANYEQDIMDALTVEGLKPVEVRSIPQPPWRNPLYAVDFLKKDATLALLQKEVSHFLMHRVKWEPAKDRNRGPLMCKRCCMHGHGAKNCCRPAICLFCAKAHLATECPIQWFVESAPTEAEIKHATETGVKLPQGYEQTRKYLCINCAGNAENGAEVNPFHRADDLKCPTKVAYALKQRDFLVKSLEKAKKPALQKFDARANNWPELRKAMAGKTAQAAATANVWTQRGNASYPPKNAHYAGSKWSPHSNPAGGKPAGSPGQTNSQQKPDQQPQTDYGNRPRNAPVDIETLMNLMISTVAELQSCTTFSEQLIIVANLIKQCIN